MKKSIQVKYTSDSEWEDRTLQGDETLVISRPEPPCGVGPDLKTIGEWIVTPLPWAAQETALFIEYQGATRPIYDIRMSEDAKSFREQQQPGDCY